MYTTAYNYGVVARYVHKYYSDELICTMGSPHIASAMELARWFQRTHPNEYAAFRAQLKLGLRNV